MMNEQSSSNEREPDPLTGEEFLRFSLESSSVYIHFEKSQIQIGSDFLVRRVGHNDCIISPQNKSAEVSMLWSSVGSRVASVMWGDDLIIKIDNGVEIVVPPSSFGYRGTILTRYGDETAMEDF